MKKRYGLLLFITAMVIVLLGCIVLVQNRQEAANQAKQIIVDDQAGTNVETDLLKLKVYAASHMKVNVQLTLTGSYNRAVEAAKAEANKSNVTYAAAQAACDKKGVDSIRQSQCVASYIAANPSPTAAPKMPNVATYQRSYVGPAWSLDLAGVLLVVGIGLGIFAVASVVHRAVTK